MAMAGGDREARDSLITAYLPFARRQAKAVFRRTGHLLMDWDDYVQSATVGLIEAVDRFRPECGVPFEAFAGYRIRGAVFNALRTLCDRGGNRQTASWALRWRERTQVMTSPEQGGLDAFISVVVGLGVGFLLEHDADAGQAGDPAYVTEALQLQAAVQQAVVRLPERERLVIQLHYLNHIPFQEIAKTLGLTKGRISQLHHQALRRLRDRLRPPSHPVARESPDASLTLSP